MKFRVTGENLTTSARMQMEIEADSKAAAERKAAAAGMRVQHAEVMSAEEIERAHRSRRKATGVHPLIKLIILLALLAGAAWFFWPTIRQWLR